MSNRPPLWKIVEMYQNGEITKKEIDEYEAIMKQEEDYKEVTCEEFDEFLKKLLFSNEK